MYYSTSISYPPHVYARKMILWRLCFVTSLFYDITYVLIYIKKECYKFSIKLIITNKNRLFFFNFIYKKLITMRIDTDNNGI